MAAINVAPEQVDNLTYLWDEVYSKQQQRISRPVDTLPLSEPVHPDKVRFVCISDTHNNLGQMSRQIPPGDVLLHAGDFSNVGDPWVRNTLKTVLIKEVKKFNDELALLPHKHKLIIAGNHDLGFDDTEDPNGRIYWPPGINHGTPQGYKLLTNCTYLHDSSTTVYGLTVYGSSWHPLAGFSFYRPRGNPILREWLKIPAANVTQQGQFQPTIDVLITHTPPLGHSDINMHNERFGDADLLNCIERRIRPRVSVFGHIHEPKNRATTNGVTLFINAAMCDEYNEPKNPPVIFDLPLPAGFSKD